MAIGSDCSGDLANMTVMGPVAMVLLAYTGGSARALRGASAAIGGSNRLGRILC
jgi:hypothetical protein